MSPDRKSSLAGSPSLLPALQPSTAHGAAPAPALPLTGWTASLSRVASLRPGRAFTNVWGVVPPTLLKLFQLGELSDVPAPARRFSLAPSRTAPRWPAYWPQRRRQRRQSWPAVSVAPSARPTSAHECPAVLAWRMDSPSALSSAIRARQHSVTPPIGFLLQSPEMDRRSPVP